MAGKQIRIGQLIAPFGPGSIYTDRQGVPHVVAGLDFWFHRWDQTAGRMVRCSDRGEFELFEPRLSALLNVDRFCLPPDYRQSGNPSPPNADLYVPALRFPRWYRHTKTGELRRFNLDTPRIERPADGGRWQPVRFISVCAAGHLCEFPWKEWIDCECPDDGKLVLTDRGGSELTSVKVECRSCQKSRDLGGTTTKPNVAQGEQSAFQLAGINCPGERPWLGEEAAENDCNEPLVGALINQTNLYFPRTMSALALPDLGIQDDEVARLRAEIEKDAGTLGVARTLWNMGNPDTVVLMIRNELNKRGVEADSSKIEAALASLFRPVTATMPAGSAEPADPESDLLAFRRAEFNIIRIRTGLDDAERVPDLRVIATTVSEELKHWFSHVNLVERLRETRAFFGFDRLEQNSPPLANMPNSAMSQLFRDPPGQSQDRWLPAAKVYGEGIYLELDEKCIAAWQKKNVKWLENRLDQAFISRLADVFQTLPPQAPADRAWASRYLLVHSLAHILINQLVFECGYSTASLRERLFVSSDRNAPMAAMLIYTAAGDSEGTLGGLVRLGRPERLGPIVQRAISRASWCSADPVCSEHLGGQGSRLANLAACHACTLLPETSCETVNQGLDRALLVGTPENRDSGFFKDILESKLY